MGRTETGRKNRIDDIEYLSNARHRRAARAEHFTQIISCNSHSTLVLF